MAIFQGLNGKLQADDSDEVKMIRKQIKNLLQANDSEQIKTIHNLIYNLLQADSNRDLKKISTFYTPQINYNGEVASKEDFLSETKAFYKSWPSANWKILDDPIVKTDNNNISNVRYKAAFRLENKSQGIYSEGILTSHLIIITTTNGKKLIQTVRNELQDSKKGLLSKNRETEQPASRNNYKSSKQTPQNRSVYSEIDRIQSIRDPNQRANANADFLRGMLGNFDQLVESNPQAFGGMSSDEFTLETYYNAAREKGLPPSEAQIEAQRQFRNMKRFMNQ
jgi:hypothetical protein